MFVHTSMDEILLQEAVLSIAKAVQMLMYCLFGLLANNLEKFGIALRGAQSLVDLVQTTMDPFYIILLIVATFVGLLLHRSLLTLWAVLIICLWITEKYTFNQEQYSAGMATRVCCVGFMLQYLMRLIMQKKTNGGGGGSHSHSEEEDRLCSELMSLRQEILATRESMVLICCRCHNRYGCRSRGKM